VTARLYASAAQAYLTAGYSPLPLPPGQKWPPPKGWTGAGAPMADLEQVRRWARSDPAGNIALRLPDDVIGIDLDLYPDPSKDHPAAERMAAWDALLSQFGPIPESPRATSRDDGVSGIRLYRVPPGWKGAGLLPAAPVCGGHPLPDGGEAKPGDPVSPGEVIQHHHRYAVAPPSIHPSGRRYRWHGGNLPAVGDLPYLERS
jgi:bifunctional DNA primase/polymerase-like protein